MAAVVRALRAAKMEEFHDVGQRVLLVEEMIEMVVDIVDIGKGRKED